MAKKSKEPTSQPVQDLADKELTQDPKERLRRAEKKLAELEDGTEASKSKKKKLHQKIAKLRKLCGVTKEAVQIVERSKGWTEEKKKEMRMRGEWTRVAPNLDIEIDEAAVKDHLDKRTAAKKVKDYGTADSHATELQEVGVCYDDTTFTWFIKQTNVGSKRGREDDSEKAEKKKKKKKKDK